MPDDVVKFLHHILIILHIEYDIVLYESWNCIYLPVVYFILQKKYLTKKTLCKNYSFATVLKPNISTNKDENET